MKIKHAVVLFLAFQALFISKINAMDSSRLQTLSSELQRVSFTIDNGILSPANSEINNNMQFFAPGDGCLTACAIPTTLIDLTVEGFIVIGDQVYVTCARKDPPKFYRGPAHQIHKIKNKIRYARNSFKSIQQTLYYLNLTQRFNSGNYLTKCEQKKCDAFLSNFGPIENIEQKKKIAQSIVSINESGIEGLFTTFLNCNDLPAEGIDFYLATVNGIRSKMDLAPIEIAND